MSQLTQPFSSRNAILALSLLHLRQRLLRLREQACAVHGRRDVLRHGDDGLEQINLRPAPLCFSECSIQVHESRHWPRRGLPPENLAATVGDYNDAVRFNRRVTLFCILLIGIVRQPKPQPD